MKKYTKTSDCNIKIPIEKYIFDKIAFLTKEYKADSISDFGMIVLIESENDLHDFHDIGFITPINENKYEYLQDTEIHSFQGSKYFKSCFIFSDRYGIIIIFEEQYFSEMKKD